jgi:hypothetical protein
MVGKCQAGEKGRNHHQSIAEPIEYLGERTRGKDEDGNLVRLAAHNQRLDDEDPGDVDDGDKRGIKEGKGDPEMAPDFSRAGNYGVHAHQHYKEGGSRDQRGASGNTTSQGAVSAPASFTTAAIENRMQKMVVITADQKPTELTDLAGGAETIMAPAS